MTMVSIDAIKSFFRGHISVHEPLAPYSSMKVGGPADYFVEPADKKDVVEIVKYFQQNDFPFMMIGRGSNLLISDDGIRGAVINAESGLSNVALEKGLVVAEAGARLTKLVDFCIQNGLAGLEWAAGIPGTVGGGVIMNAGAHGGEMSNHIVEVEVLRGGEVVRVPKEASGFSYRRSAFQRDIVLGATFRLTPGNKEEILKRKSELIARRNLTQPLNFPNSGSMFKNPPGTFAAKLIEQAGLKGKRIGDAQISDKHANFIINLGDAKADDILRLIDLARRTVHQNTGVLLELEVKLVGFSQEVLSSVA